VILNGSVIAVQTAGSERGETLLIYIIQRRIDLSTVPGYYLRRTEQKYG
jgi:hypothetical protein